MDHSIESIINKRYGQNIEIDGELAESEGIRKLANRRVHRKYQDREVSEKVLRLVCACALSAPSKSDLQQADILIVKRPDLRHALCELLPDQTWMKTAPVFLLFLANGKRLKDIAAERNRPFANDHLDAFFNCCVDAAIVLNAFMNAADIVGLGCCPISVIRDHAQAVSDMLRLPERVFPIAGMCVGWPAAEGEITPRLPLTLTIQQDLFTDDNFKQELEAFDRRRERTHTLTPRNIEKWGPTHPYTWSEDKARQFGVPQCQDFGTFIRNKGFILD